MTAPPPELERQGPLHVAYVHYQTSGDTANHHVRQFAAAARELGHRVDVLALRSEEAAAPPAGLAETERAETERAETQRAETTGPKDAWVRRALSRYGREPKELLSGLLYHRRAVAAVGALAPDVLLVRHHSLIATAFLTARSLDLPLVLEVNAPRAEAMTYDHEHLHVPVIPEWLEAKQLRSAQRVVVVSGALRDHLVAEHELDESRFVVSPNGADTTLFHPRVAPSPQLEQWRRGATVVGYVGAFKRWHGVELLAEVTRELAAARPRTRFLFVGAAPVAGPLRDVAAALGERVVFTGSVAHDLVPGLVAALDVALLPETAFYCSPLKVLEWMAAGRAVVAPGYGPLHEIITPGREGLLFEPGAEEALMTALLRLVDDRPLREKLGTAAAARVERELTWEHNAARVLAACRAAVEERRRERPPRQIEPPEPG
jgi:glycosyltransferase involved in cell wall biosynthesis